MPTSNPVPIIVIIGQSNAEGIADVSGVTSPLWSDIGLQNPFPAVTYYEKVENAPSDPIAWDLERGPVSLSPRPGGNQGTMGVELSLGRALTQRGRTVALVKVAIGSTFLGGATPHWQAVSGPFPSTPPSLFDTMVAFVQSVEVAQQGKVAGFVWIQGEADATQLAAANAYDTNLFALVDQLRVTWPRSWFAFNQLNVNLVENFVTMVRAKQATVAAAMQRTIMISCDDLDLLGAHFTSQGYYDLGNRFAAAIHQIMYWPASGVGPSWY